MSKWFTKEVLSGKTDKGIGEADRGGKDAQQAWDLSKDWQRVVSTNPTEEVMLSVG